MIELLAFFADWVYLWVGGLVVTVLLIVTVRVVRVRRRRKQMELLSAKTQPSKANQPRTDLDFGLQFIQESGEVFKFSSLPILIGGSSQNDIVLSDEAVAPQHARVYYDKNIDAVCVQDLSSNLGMMVDDLPTKKNVLNDGNCIQLGRSKLVFRDTGYIHPLSR